MADTKISALPASTTPLAGTEVLPIVQSGVTRQVSVDNLTAGRAVSAASVTASTGNFVVGTSGQGIDFSATPGTGTSELLDDYERGTFTAVVADAATGGNTSTTATSFYTKIGNIVTCEIDLVNISTVGLTAGNALHVRGLPFDSANNQSAAFPVLVGGVVFAGYVEAYMGDNRTFFTFYDCISGAPISLIQVLALTSGSARIIMGFSYRTA